MVGTQALGARQEGLAASEQLRTGDHGDWNDGLLTGKQSLLALLRVALGETGVINPLTNEPFQISQTEAGTVIESTGRGNRDLLFFMNESEEWMFKIEIPSASKADPSDTKERSDQNGERPRAVEGGVVPEPD
jgi:hypothetical protein